MSAEDDHHYQQKWRPGGGNGPAGFAYFLGIIGAAVYYIQNAVTFGGGVIGILKAFVWPAFLIYQALRFMHA